MNSIEWLASQLGEHIIWEEKIINLVEQAKLLHKQEIVKAFDDAQMLDSQLFQQEISDEEIEKAARDYDNSVIYGPPLLHFEQGEFWYREQISLKADKK